jgi:hypothetical protein
VAIIGAGCRGLQFAKAVREFQLNQATSGAALGIRVTSIVDPDPSKRATVKSILQSEGSDEFYEFDEIEDLLVDEEFGEFHCTAVIVACESPQERVEVCKRAMAKRKHCLVEPWAPSTHDATRLNGMCGPFCQLVDACRNAESSLVLSFADHFRLLAAEIRKWLNETLPSGDSICGAHALVSAPPVQDTKVAAGWQNWESGAWISALRLWLAKPDEGQTPVPHPVSDKLGVVASILDTKVRVHAESSVNILNLASGVAAHVLWEAPGVDGPINARFNLLARTASVVINLRLDGSCWPGGSAEATMVIDGGAEIQRKSFSLEPLQSLLIQNFLDQVESGVGSTTASTDTLMDDRRLYADVLRGRLGVPGPDSSEA